MNLSRKREKRHIYYPVAAFLIPFFGMLLVMLINGYKPFGKYSMLYSDMYHQYYPFFVAFRRALRSGDSLLYSWNVGMGMDYLGLISYYLASPLNLLSVLVPEGWLLSYFSLLMPVKLGLAGLFFALMLKKLYGKNDFSLALFGSLYALCAWALGYQWNIMWLDTFALLPLVILGEIALLRQRKFILYTLMLFLSIYANYYIGFFTCIFVALVFFCYEICRPHGAKRFFHDLFLMAVFSAIAIGMTAIMTLPALAALQTTQSSVNNFPTGFRLNIASANTFLGLLDAMRQVAGNMGGSLEPSFKEGLPNLYCGVGTVLLGFLFLMAKDVKLRDKLCAVFLLIFFMLSFIIRQLDYIWHGFHFTNMIPYRFSFLYSFVLLYMAYRAWLLRRKFSDLQILTAMFLTAAVLCCSGDLITMRSVDFLNYTLKIPVYLIYNVSFLLMYTAALLVGVKKKCVAEDADLQTRQEARIYRLRVRLISRRFSMAAAGVEIAAILVSFAIWFPGTNVSNYPKGTEYAASMIRYMHEREAHTLFYRAETTHSQTLNDGALNNYNGISTFTSSANVKTTEFMRALGYGAKNTYNRYCFEESSPVANLFLNLKYMLDRDGRDMNSTYFTQVHQYGSVGLLENNAYLPLGFLAEDALGDLEFSAGKDPFLFQNRLFIAAAGVEESVWNEIEQDHVSAEGTGTTVTPVQSDGTCSYTECASGAEVLYTFTADREGFACIYLDLPKRNDFIVSVNDQELYREVISLPQMLAVQDVKPGDKIYVRVLCDQGEKSTMRVTAAILNGAVFQKGYTRLSESVLGLTTFRNTFVEGIIECNRDGLLYTSIPQDGNWHAYVDGEETNIIPIGNCMVGVELEKGTHTVTFRYRNAAFDLGWRVTAVCTAVLLLLIQLIYKPDWKKLSCRHGKFEK